MPPTKKPKVTPSKRFNPMAFSHKGPKVPKPEHVFKGPQGEAPDMRIEVFGTEFHVCSQVLKLYSAFFDKFLEPANKPPKPDVPLGSGELKYEWVTKVDDDAESYYLTDLANYTPRSPNAKRLSRGQLKPEDETTGFRNLLCVLNRESYDIQTSEEFSKLVELADYYLALPVVAKSIEQNLLIHGRWRAFKDDIPRSCVSLLPVALKLKNEWLFKDCCIFLCNPYSDPKLNLLEDPNLKAVAKIAHAQTALELNALLLDYIDNIAGATPVVGSDKTTLDCLKDAIPTVKRGKDGKLLPASLFNRLESTEMLNRKHMQTSIMYSYMLLNNSTFCPDLEADDDNFYCGLIDDDLLPWNTK